MNMTLTVTQQLFLNLFSECILWNVSMTCYICHEQPMFLMKTIKNICNDEEQQTICLKVLVLKASADFDK